MALKMACGTNVSGSNVAILTRLDHVLLSWSQAALLSADAQTMQAVPNMLEIVPRGVNKVRGRSCFHACRVLPVRCGLVLVATILATESCEPRLALWVSAFELPRLSSSLPGLAVGGHAAVPDGD